MDWNTLTIVGSVAASSFGLGVFITRIGNDIKDALTTHILDDSEKFHDHSLRLQRVELYSFGETHSGKNPDKMDLKN